jgi:hypothetical protein
MKITAVCDAGILREEGLNGENGLLLTPTMGHLFDRGFISFEGSGLVIVSPVAHTPSLNRMGVATDRVINVGTFTQGQNSFLTTIESLFYCRLATRRALAMANVAGLGAFKITLLPQR